MNKPLVNIITPVHNCARYIGDTISSVMGQDYQNIRYLVIDDASTDHPQFRPDTLNFKVIKHTKNKGEQERVNEGMRHVIGKYFMIVNADDPLLPGAVSALVEFMEANPKVLCAYPDYRVIGENGEWRHHVVTREYDFAWMIRNHTWIPSVGSMFRSEIIKTVGYRDTSFRWLGDGDYWFRVGLVGQMAHVPRTLACWRKRRGQASDTKSDDRAQDHIKVVQKFYQDIESQWNDEESRTLSFLYTYMVLEHLKKEAICWSYLVAAGITDSNKRMVIYAYKAISTYPMMFLRFRFWGVFLKRLRKQFLFILRAR